MRLLRMGCSCGWTPEDAQHPRECILRSAPLPHHLWTSEHHPPKWTFRHILPSHQVGVGQNVGKIYESRAPFWCRWGAQSPSQTTYSRYSTGGGNWDPQPRHRSGSQQKWLRQSSFLLIAPAAPPHHPRTPHTPRTDPRGPLPDPARTRHNTPHRHGAHPTTTTRHPTGSVPRRPRGRRARGPAP